MFYGSARSQTPKRSREKHAAFLSRFKSLPFDDDIATIYGDLRVTLEKAGMPISHPDLQIAATALRHNLILVTHNTREFARVANLDLEDWELQES